MGFLALISGARPTIAIPSFGAAPFGWILGVILLIGPFFFMVFMWRRRTRLWWALFTQWNALSFWLLIFGSIIAAIGIFILIGVIPAWQNELAQWSLALTSNNPGADLTPLQWIQNLQNQYTFVMQMGAATLFLAGSAAIMVSEPRLARRLTKFSLGGPDDWLLAPPDTGKNRAVQSKMLNKNPLT